MWRAIALVTLGQARAVKLAAIPVCKGSLVPSSKMCGDLTLAECADSYIIEADSTYMQCGITTGKQCLTIGPVCQKPKVSLPDGGLEFYFGSSLASGVASDSILDKGKSYGSQKASGMDYGWLCNGSPITGYDFAGGRRAPPRSTYGLNHFDRSNKCKSGSTYLPVTWKLDVPDGKYKVEVIFPESTTPECQVQGSKVCGSRGPCTYSKVIQVTGGLKVTGYGHDSRKCHSVSKVKVMPPPSLPDGGLEFYFGSSLASGVASDSILDKGKSYGSQKASGMDYGWLCNGSPITGYDFAGGRRAPPRSTYGLNHFDRSNKCKSGSTYLPVTWKLDVPDGKYKVEVIFPESTTPECQVQGSKVCGSRGPCTYSKVIQVTGGLKVTGYGHDSRKCHSVSKVKVMPA